MYFYIVISSDFVSIPLLYLSTSSKLPTILASSLLQFLDCHHTIGSPFLCSLSDCKWHQSVGSNSVYVRQWWKDGRTLTCQRGISLFNDYFHLEVIVLCTNSTSQSQVKWNHNVLYLLYMPVFSNHHYSSRLQYQL